MIAFDLQCTNGHTFEGWFEDGQAYDEQKEKGLIACPVCNNTSVSRIPSAFAIKSSSTIKDSPGQQIDLTGIGKQVADFVEKNFDDVGCDFAREALKIHYGVSEPKNIRGVSTRKEEKILMKEGIQFFKIPLPKQSDTDA